MMNKFLVLAITALTGCGQDEDYSDYGPCNELFDGSVCYHNSGNFNLDERMLQLAFSIDDNNINFIFKKETYVTTSDLVETEPLKIFFLEKENGGYRGLFVDGGDNKTDIINIFLDTNYDETDPVMCMEKYYVLSHELLHYFVLYNGLESFSNEDTHDVPNVFIQWAIDTNNLWLTTVEYFSFVDFARLCGYWDN